MASPFRDRKRDPDGSPDVSSDKTEGTEELPIRSPRKKKTVQGKEMVAFTWDYSSQRPLSPKSNNRDELLPEKGAVDDEEGTGRLGGIIGPVVSVAVAPRVEEAGEANPATPGVVGVRMKAEGRLGFVNAMREAQVKAFNDFLLQACTERMSLLEHKESHLAEWASRFEDIMRRQEQARPEAFQLALINMESSFQQQAALVQRGYAIRLEAERERMGKEARQEVLNSGLVEDTVQGRTTDIEGQLAVTRVAHKELEALVLERSGMVEKLRVERAGSN
ncbi:hypothetical protein DYB35_013343 [Aphanomyces astaci]|uniref:Uncharacterized protein n=1 Tax=Aphanomyces astaci TaxID=112090 RepID=A0A3R7B4V9_APHAT|nr:hypothetical protein DYB35_013343 [Aphanomyces astaci]